MRSRLSDQDRQLIDRVLDAVASDADRASFDARLSDPAFAEAYRELRALKELVGAQSRLQPDPHFWTKVHGSLERRSEETEDLLPVPRQYLPVFGGVFALLLLFASSYIFENRLSFIRFWETQSEAVINAVERGINQGSFLPVFSDLDEDRTLQFALYGSLPIDEARGTMLNVDERSNEGYRIEVQKEEPRKQKRVTVDQFVAEVRPTTSQKAAIDSLLTVARRDLESAVLLGSNNALAINADLSRLNKVMATSIVGVLEPEQRVRLKRMLSERDVAYILADEMRDAAAAKHSFRAMAEVHGGHEFVILSPETVALARVQLDVEKMHAELKSQQMQQVWTTRRQKAMEMLIDHPQVFGGTFPGAAVAPNISVRSRKDRLTIQVFSDSSSFEFSVAPHVYRESAPDSGELLQVTVPGFPERPKAASPGGRVYVAPPNPSKARAVVVDSVKPAERKPRRPFKIDID